MPERLRKGDVVTWVWASGALGLGIYVRTDKKDPRWITVEYEDGIVVSFYVTHFTKIGRL